ncbi:MAG TPA: copper resistance protein CopC [Candidatus Acidoferrales bacterium]|nr:copper resistance protein CopC [Candidatus Acidoferrales bacterium]
MTGLLGSAAVAHANYMDSSPKANERLSASPAKITVKFSEAYDPKQSGLELVASDGHSVVAGGTPQTVDELALSVPPLGDGPYTVLWHTVSAVDGDAAKGFFAFMIGADKPATTTVQRAGDQSGIHVALTIMPARVGANDYRATVSDANGPVANVTRVRLRIERPDRDIGVAFTELAASSGGFGGTDMSLSFAGPYRVTVEVRRKDILQDLSFPFDVTVPAAVAATPSPVATTSATTAATSAPAAATDTSGLLAAAAVAIIIIGGIAAFAMRRR